MTRVTVVEDVAWIRVEHESAVGAVRRAAIALAQRLGFDQTRVGEIGIVATELAGNQVKHAGGGSLLIRACRDGAATGVELVATDVGPGIADLRRALADGESSTGTLGIGLGAIDRLATSWDAFAGPGQGGAVLTVSFGLDGVSRVGDQVVTAGITRPMPQEQVCGDGYAVRVDSRADGGRTVSGIMVDGLGHGPLAATAATTAVRAFREAAVGDPVALLTVVHRALAGGRGAAAAVVQFGADTPGGPVEYAGIGNISGWLTDGRQRRGMISHPGIAGAQARTLRSTSYQPMPHAVVVMHSDGVSDRMDLGSRPGLAGRSPVLVAATVLRDYGVRRDDAGVLVLRLPERW